MKRDVARLSAGTFDVLVVGGGICGLTIACDAAQRGLKVALIERDDFGSGSSFNHLRTIHGGLRYLQHLDFTRSRESIKERRSLARIAPQTLRPQLFVLPLYRSLLRGPLAMRAGMLLDRIVSSDRNRDIPSSLHLPAGRVVTRDEAVARIPDLKHQELAGAALWYDYVATEADRLTFSWALAAASHGATMANHVEATAPLVDGRRAIGARAVDRISGQSVDVAARVTVNATGSALDALLAPLGLSADVPLLKAMNLVTTRPAGDAAIGGVSASGKSFFLVPWRGRALFGTWESKRHVSATEHAVKSDDVTEFIGELNEAFPTLRIDRSDVSLVHRGLVPAAAGTNGSAALERRAQARDHASDGVEGLMSVAGTKYTTARGVAERVTDQIIAKLGRTPVPCHTSVTPLPGSDLNDVTLAIRQAHTEFETRLSNDTIAHLVGAYGSSYRDVIQIADGCAAWLAPISESSPVIGAQLIWAVRHEMAMTLPDATIRRTPLGALGHPGAPAAKRAATLMAQECGWPAERIEAELSSLDRFYQL